MPPAVQIEIRPRLAWFSSRIFRERGDDARAGRSERMADREAASLHIESGSINGAESARQLQLVAAENRVGPGLECAQHLSGESLVNLVEVEVLELRCASFSIRGTA